jgi:hypothetical protein
VETIDYLYSLEKSHDPFPRTFTCKSVTRSILLLATREKIEYLLTKRKDRVHLVLDQEGAEWLVARWQEKSQIHRAAYIQSLKVWEFPRSLAQIYRAQRDLCVLERLGLPPGLDIFIASYLA